MVPSCSHAHNLHVGSISGRIFLLEICQAVVACYAFLMDEILYCFSLWFSWKFSKRRKKPALSITMPDLGNTILRPSKKHQNRREIVVACCFKDLLFQLSNHPILRAREYISQLSQSQTSNQQQQQQLRLTTAEIDRGEGGSFVLYSLGSTR